jgi:hypothetical protein
MGQFAVRFSSGFLALLAAGGCEDSTTLVLEPNPAVAIFIDASRCPEIRKCNGCQLGYEAFDKNGNPASFPTVVWTSENPTVATVNQAGRVDGWETGGATIVAEVLETGATDEVSVQVVPPPRPVTCTPPPDLGAVTMANTSR